MSYDPKCEELARHFLPREATPEQVANFAQAIQDSVESTLEYLYPGACGSPGGTHV